MSRYLPVDEFERFTENLLGMNMDNIEEPIRNDSPDQGLDRSREEVGGGDNQPLVGSETLNDVPVTDNNTIDNTENGLKNDATEVGLSEKVDPCFRSENPIDLPDISADDTENAAHSIEESTDSITEDLTRGLSGKAQNPIEVNVIIMNNNNADRFENSTDTESNYSMTEGSLFNLGQWIEEDFDYSWLTSDSLVSTTYDDFGNPLGNDMENFWEPYSGTRDSLNMELDQSSEDGSIEIPIDAILVVDDKNRLIDTTTRLENNSRVRESITEGSLCVELGQSTDEGDDPLITTDDNTSNRLENIGESTHSIANSSLNMGMGRGGKDVINNTIDNTENRPDYNLESIRESSDMENYPYMAEGPIDLSIARRDDNSCNDSGNQLKNGAESIGGRDNLDLGLGPSSENDNSVEHPAEFIYVLTENDLFDINNPFVLNMENNWDCSIREDSLDGGLGPSIDENDDTDVPRIMAADSTGCLDGFGNNIESNGESSGSITEHMSESSKNNDDIENPIDLPSRSTEDNRFDDTEINTIEGSPFSTRTHSSEFEFGWDLDEDYEMENPIAPTATDDCLDVGLDRSIEEDPCFDNKIETIGTFTYPIIKDDHDQSSDTDIVESPAEFIHIITDDNKYEDTENSLEENIQGIAVSTNSITSDLHLGNYPCSSSDNLVDLPLQDESCNATGIVYENSIESIGESTSSISKDGLGEFDGKGMDSNTFECPENLLDSSMEESSYLTTKPITADVYIENYPCSSSDNLQDESRNATGIGDENNIESIRESTCSISQDSLGMELRQNEFDGRCMDSNTFECPENLLDSSMEESSYLTTKPITGDVHIENYPRSSSDNLQDESCNVTGIGDENNIESIGESTFSITEDSLGMELCQSELDSGSMDSDFECNESLLDSSMESMEESSHLTTIPITGDVHIENYPYSSSDNLQDATRIGDENNIESIGESTFSITEDSLGMELLQSELDSKCLDSDTFECAENLLDSSMQESSHLTTKPITGDVHIENYPCSSSDNLQDESCNATGIGDENKIESIGESTFSITEDSLGMELRQSELDSKCMDSNTFECAENLLDSSMEESSHLTTKPITGDVHIENYPCSNSDNLQDESCNATGIGYENNLESIGESTFSITEDSLGMELRQSELDSKCMDSNTFECAENLLDSSMQESSHLTTKPITGDVHIENYPCSNSDNLQDESCNATGIGDENNIESIGESTFSITEDSLGMELLQSDLDGECLDSDAFECSESLLDSSMESMEESSHLTTKPITGDVHIENYPCSSSDNRQDESCNATGIGDENNMSIGESTCSISQDSLGMELRQNEFDSNTFECAEILLDSSMEESSHLTIKPITGDLHIENYPCSSSDNRQDESRNATGIGDENNIESIGESTCSISQDSLGMELRQNEFDSNTFECAEILLDSSMEESSHLTIKPFTGDLHVENYPCSSSDNRQDESCNATGIGDENNMSIGESTCSISQDSLGMELCQNEFDSNTFECAEILLDSSKEESSHLTTKPITGDLHIENYPCSSSDNLQDESCNATGIGYENSIESIGESTFSITENPINLPLISAHENTCPDTEKGFEDNMESIGASTCLITKDSLDSGLGQSTGEHNDIPIIFDGTESNVVSTYSMTNDSLDVGLGLSSDKDNMENHPLLISEPPVEVIVIVSDDNTENRLEINKKSYSITNYNPDLVLGRTIKQEIDMENYPSFVSENPMDFQLINPEDIKMENFGEGTYSVTRDDLDLALGRSIEIDNNIVNQPFFTYQDLMDAPIICTDDIIDGTGNVLVNNLESIGEHADGQGMVLGRSIKQEVIDMDSINFPLNTDSNTYYYTDNDGESTYVITEYSLDTGLDQSSEKVDDMQINPIGIPLISLSTTYIKSENIIEFPLTEDNTFDATEYRLDNDLVSIGESDRAVTKDYLGVSSEQSDINEIPIDFPFRRTDDNTFDSENRDCLDDEFGWTIDDDDNIMQNTISFPLNSTNCDMEISPDETYLATRGSLGAALGRTSEDKPIARDDLAVGLDRSSEEDYDMEGPIDYSFKTMKKRKKKKKRDVRFGRNYEDEDFMLSPLDFSLVRTNTNTLDNTENNTAGVSGSSHAKSDNLLRRDDDDVENYTFFSSNIAIDFPFLANSVSKPLDDKHKYPQNDSAQFIDISSLVIPSECQGCLLQDTKQEQIKVSRKRKKKSKSKSSSMSEDSNKGKAAKKRQKKGKNSPPAKPKPEPEKVCKEPRRNPKRQVQMNKISLASLEDLYDSDEYGAEPDDFKKKRRPGRPKRNTTGAVWSPPRPLRTCDFKVWPANGMHEKPNFNPETNQLDVIPEAPQMDVKPECSNAYNMMMAARAKKKLAKKPPKAKPRQNMEQSTHESLHHVLLYVENLKQYNTMTGATNDDNIKDAQSILADTCMLYCAANNVTKSALAAYINSITEKDDVLGFLEEFVKDMERTDTEDDDDD